MTRYVPPEVQSALEQGRLVARDFVTFIVRTRDSPPVEVQDSYWSDVGSVFASVIDPATGSPVTRAFLGSGSLINLSDITLVSNLTVQTMTIQLSQVSDRANDLVRDYDCKQGQIQVFRGLFNPDTRELVSPAEPRFWGNIDEIEIVTPKEGEAGNVVLSCTSNTQEMTRSSPDTRSDASQRLRSATDDFLADAVAVGTWQQSWGRAGGPIRTSKGGSLGLPTMRPP